MDPGRYVARLVRSTLADVDTLLDQILTAAAQRLPDAGITVFDAWVHEHHYGPFYSGVFKKSIGESERLLRAAADMAESIAILLEASGRSVVSPYVLSRSLGEGVMRLCYLLDPDVPPARTLLRMAVFQLATIEGNLETARAFGPDGADKEPEILANIATLHGWFADNGIERIPGRRTPYTASLSLDGETENVRFNATAAYQRYMPFSAWSYNIGSGATHSRGWMLPSLVGTLEEGPLATTIENVVAVGNAVLDAADALARVGARHAATDVDWFLRKTHLRRRGLVRLAGKGSDVMVGHDEYAARAPGSTRTEGSPGISFWRPPLPSPNG